MKNKLLCIAPWMVFTAATWGAQLRPAEVRLTSYPAIKEGAVRLGDECFIPITAVKNWGWEAEEEGGSANLIVGKTKLRVPEREISGHQCIPLRLTAEKLGAVSEWDEARNSFRIYARITSITAMRGQLHIETNLPITPQAFTLDSPNRIVIDLPGALIDSRSQQAFDDAGRATQYKPDTVRVVLVTNSDFSLPLNLSQPTKVIDISTEKLQEKGQKPEPEPTAPVKERDPGESPPKQDEGSAGGFVATTGTQTPTETPSSTTPSIALANVGGVHVDMEGPRSAALSLTLNGAVPGTPLFSRPEPRTIEITLPGVKLDLGKDPVSSSSIESIDTRQTPNAAVLILKLSRPMGVELSIVKNTVQILLQKPEVGNGHLAGKIVVVDAGHGGFDTGATSPDGGLAEKTLTLSIAKKVAEKLSSQGATVIMTRKDDTFIKLPERPEIGNRNKADFFISIHINSCRLDNSTSGSMSFYHKSDPVSQLLADSILHEIARTSGLPSLGCKSDLALYSTGLAVLRGSKGPATLLELGFINHSKDRIRMQEESFQYLVAGAIARGIRVYLGDSTE